VHALLAPEHLREEPLLGALFVAGAALELGLVLFLALRTDRAAIAAATLTLAGMLIGYVPFVLFRLPGFPMTPEPLERVALVTKAVELAGAAAGIALLARPARPSRRPAPAAAAVLLACLAAGAAAPPSHADTTGAERSVDIPGQLYSPDVLPVLVGDTVTWTNHDHMTHTVTSDDFDSDRLAPGARFSYTFTKPGVYRYHCTIHRFMHGEIDVYAVALIGPDRSIPLGATVTLSGLSPGGAGSVSLEQEQPDGSYEATASASPAADGSFQFPVAVSGPARFRARAGADVSDPVALRPEPKITIVVRRVGRRAAVAVAAAPDQAGAPVAVERYVHERYWWMPIREARLGANGRVTVVVPAKAHGIRFRAHLLHGRSGWGEAKSAPATLR
jgi:plastocyanin